jgi:hypothetical protein
VKIKAQSSHSPGKEESVKRIACIIGVLGALCSAALARDASPKIWAALSVNDSITHEERTRELIFNFALINNGKQPVALNITDSRLLINNRELRNWKSSMVAERGIPGVLKPGASVQFSSEYYEDFYDALERPGSYTLRWTGKNFQAPPLTVRVLPNPGNTWTPIVLVRAIRAQLPPGWKVFYTPRGVYRCIEVVRSKPTVMYRMTAPNENPFEKKPNPVQKFRLEFDIESYLSPEEYSGRKAANEETREQMRELAASLRSIDHKFDSFLPRAPEEKARVAQYEGLRNALRDLPEFSYRDIGLSWSMPMTFRFGVSGGIESYYRRILDEDVRAECGAVTRKVLGLLSRYEPAPKVEDEDERKCAS